VIGDVAAASGLVDLDAARSERLVGRKNVRAAAVAANAERQHVWMFEEEQRIADPAGPTLFNERPLQRERLGVRHATEPADR